MQKIWGKEGGVLEIWQGFPVKTGSLHRGTNLFNIWTFYRDSDKFLNGKVMGK